MYVYVWKAEKTYISLDLIPESVHITENPDLFTGYDLCFSKFQKAIAGNWYFVLL